MEAFNPVNYDKLHVMRCDTEEEARSFCDYMGTLGFKWSSGEPFDFRTYWYDGIDHIYYYFYQGTFSHTSPSSRYVILFAHDFDFGVSESTEPTELAFSYDSLMNGEDLNQISISLSGEYKALQRTPHVRTSSRDSTYGSRRGWQGLVQR